LSGYLRAPLAIEDFWRFLGVTSVRDVFRLNKVSPRAHLTSTWLVAIGASLSALWIMVAIAWMQYRGEWFNPKPPE
jgi:cytochrome d ubiquinol oxidase subunit I